MKNKRIIIAIVAFLLLIPFRLPISVLLIKSFDYIAQLEGTRLSLDILSANIVLTKLIYNIVLSSLTIYNIEMQSRIIFDRKAVDDANSDMSVYWWCGVLIAFLFCYIIFDGFTSYDLFYEIHSFNK